MPSASKFNNFVHHLATKQVNLNSDVLKIMLTAAAPSATFDVYADVSAGDLATANGYTNGGGTVTGVSSGQSPPGTEQVNGSPFTWTATGAIGPFRYAILRDTTFDCLIEWWDYGSPITMGSADTFTWTPTGSVLLTLT